MDIIKILRDAIDRLPDGDHSPGLSAIMRHISNAIRHFERREDGESDTFTDAIYRTNQAYEGSLKEAYRVLAAKDPHGKTPNEIEKYLESKKIVRPRVLTQLTRYRQDYRNPSTHDYKLDFDEDEALLAIVSVCAFAKLLVDQISERLAFNAAISEPPIVSRSNLNLSDKDVLVDTILKTCIEYADSVDRNITQSEFEGGLAGRLAAIGLDTDSEYCIPGDDDGLMWDILVSYELNTIPIEIRFVSKEYKDSEAHGIPLLNAGMSEEEYSAGFVVLLAKGARGYNGYRTSSRNGDIYIISHYGINDVADINRDIANDLALVG